MSAVTPFPCRGPWQASCLQSTREHASTDRTRFPIGANTWNRSETILPNFKHLRNGAQIIKMKAVIFVAVGTLLLSPASCQSGKLFSYGVEWEGWFVSQESTESNLFYISHKLHCQRQSLILVIKRWNHGREEI